MKTKRLVLSLSLLLVFAIAVVGTLAWLTDRTAPVKNTFTTSDVDIDLSETKGGTAHEFKMVPGATIEKDPFVTVKAVSEKAYVFVKLEKSTNFDAFMTYTVADGWTELTANAGIYYRVVEDTNADQTFKVLANDTVSVKSDVTKAQMNALTAATYPTLSVTAYAVQYEGMTGASDAWSKAPQS